MSTDPILSRRTALVSGVAAVGAVALAGCASGTSAPVAAGGNAPASTPPASTPPAVSKAPANSGGASLANLAEVPVGGSFSAQGADGKPVVLAQPTAGKVVCFTAICTHSGCTVKPAGAELHCPCHGSKFDAFTGKVLAGPAQGNLAAIPVKVEAGKVVSG